MVTLFNLVRTKAGPCLVLREEIQWPWKCHCYNGCKVLFRISEVVAIYKFEINSENIPSWSRAWNFDELQYFITLGRGLHFGLDDLYGRCCCSFVDKVVCKCFEPPDLFRVESTPSQANGIDSYIGKGFACCFYVRRYVLFGLRIPGYKSMITNHTKLMYGSHAAKTT